MSIPDSMLTEDEILSIFGLNRVDLAVLQPVAVAKRQAKAERDFFVNVYIPNRIADIVDELNTTEAVTDAGVTVSFDYGYIIESEMQ